LIKIKVGTSEQVVNATVYVESDGY